MADEFNPSEHTVPEVLEYLASLDDTDAEAHDAEVQRIYQAEADGEARKGVLEAIGGTPAEESTLTEAQQRTEAQQAQVAETGVLHDSGLLDRDAEDFQGVKPAADSAPDGVSTKTTDGFVVARGDDPKAYVHTKGTTMREQKAPSLEGEHYRQGYVGDLPGGKDRPDLTLQGVLKGQDTGEDQES